MEEAAVVAGRGGGRMNRWKNQMEEREEETWGRMLKGKRKEEG